MKFFCMCPEGFEDVCARELKETIPNASAITIEPSVVLFETNSLLDGCRFAYMSQSIERACVLLKKTNPEDILNDKKKLFSDKDLDSEYWFDKSTDFRAEAKVVSSTNIISSDIEASAGAKVLSVLENKKGRVNLKTPKLQIFAYVLNNSAYIGIDLNGINSSKRNYKLFSHASSLNGSFGYCIVRYAGFNASNTSGLDTKKRKKDIESQVLLDPFAGSGIIPIEAAMHLEGMSPNKFSKDKMIFTKLVPLSRSEKIDIEKEMLKWDKEALDRHESNKENSRVYGSDSSMWAVNAQKKNAKIAGINKTLGTSRVDIEWLDTKYNKGEVDLIVTNPPQVSKRSNNKEVEKIYKEFFYQAEFVLKKSGIITVALTSKESKEKLIDAGKAGGYTCFDEREAMQGQERFYLMKFRLDKKNSKQESSKDL